MAAKKRLTNTRGEAYADGKARWEVHLRRPDGSQAHRTFSTRKAAELWERTELQSFDSGSWTPASAKSIRLTTYADLFLVERPKPLAPRTLELYRQLLDRFILPTFGPRKLSAIRTDEVRRWLALVIESATQIQAAKAYRLLRAILNVAVDDGLLQRNPCAIRGAGQEHSAERPLATADEIQALADVIAPHMKALVLLAGFGGLRHGELLGLHRGDIDVAACTLRVQRQALYLQKRGRVEAPPKSKAGVRTVTLPAFVAEALAHHLDEWTPPGPEAPVFIGERGGPLAATSLAHEFSRARAQIGLEHVTLHDLRHAAGTMAAWTGATTRELMARLGHSTTDASMRYQHAAQTRDAEIAAKLDLFRRA